MHDKCSRSLTLYLEMIMKVIPMVVMEMKKTMQIKMKVKVKKEMTRKKMTLQKVLSQIDQANCNAIPTPWNGVGFDYILSNYIFLCQHLFFLVGLFFCVHLHILHTQPNVFLHILLHPLA